jgi:integrase/recombinase XerD
VRHRPRSGRYTGHKDAEYHLSRNELERLIEGTCNTRDKTLVTLFVETGIRRFEAASLVSGDLDSRQSLLIVRSGKGGKLRMLPLSDRLAARLSTVASDEAAVPLFRTASGNPLGIRQINRIITVAGERAGIGNPNPRHKNITCHLLRHSFARHWKDVGGNIETLAKILGHSSVKTTWDMYGTQSIDDIRRNYRQIIHKIATKE